MTMKPLTRIPRVVLLSLSGAGALAVSASAQTAPASSDPVTVLEKFIASESTMGDTKSLLQNSRPVDSLFGASRSLLDTPRSVTLLTPETLTQRGIKTIWDLASAVPGSKVVNFYGVPALPVTRTLFSSIYFNGMQRVWNRNGYPTSFGSLEGMDYVRGPATAVYSAAQPGGYVNFLPKAPYFDKVRGSLTFSYGSHDEFNTQIDAGGPVLVFGTPAAYRISITNQAADSYYKGIKNDFVSIYSSFKAKLSPNVTIYSGGEYYRHRAKENPGWNRVTQDLIDNDNYIYGQPINDLTGARLTLTLPSGKVATFVNDAPGYVNRPALESATPFGGTRGNFDYSFLALGNSFAGSGFNAANVAKSADATFLYQYMGKINNPTAKTVKLSGSTVLTDAADFANADTFLYFFDTTITPSSNTTIVNKFFIDAYTREKISSYGYGEYGENITFEDKVIVTQKLPALKGINLVYGVSARYEDSIAKTEFTVEPFNRRDISVGASPNDRLLSGSQRGNTGRTYWDPFGSFYSKQFTGGLFFVPDIKITDDFSVILSARADNASWDRGVPSGLGNGAPAKANPSGGKTYTNFSVSPSYKIGKEVTLYATAQKGTSFGGFYVSGSNDGGDRNFQESSLYEAGFKTSLLENKVYTATTVYQQELTNFDVRGGYFTPTRGQGFEFEAGYSPTKQLTITGTFTAERSRNTNPNGNIAIASGYVPATAADIVNYAGIYTADFGGRTSTKLEINKIESYGSLFANYSFGNGFGISGGPSFTPSKWANADQTMRLPSFVLWNANIYYRGPRWDVSLAAKNIFSARYFHPFDSFASNSIILKGEPVHVNATFKYMF